MDWNRPVESERTTMGRPPPTGVKTICAPGAVEPETADPASLAARIQQKFQIAANVMETSVRMERKDGHRFITDLVEAFPGEVESISVSKPTLEDVFIGRTGHRFWKDKDAEQNNEVKK